ncbi:MAG: glycosyltransferase family 4 protein [Elusimicrobia bacterium]|nr:glycosyltransferase family 4 protein [Elusimicrobiota bacterium]
MRIGLAGFDPADATDLAVAAHYARALRRRGHRVVARGAEVWHLHLFGRDPGPFLRKAERGRWPVVTTLHLVLADYLRFAGGRRTLERLARLGPLAAVCAAQRREALRLVPALAGRLRAVYSCGPSLPRARGRAAAPIILCSARLAPYKGIDLLLMAFARLRETRPEARLVLAGRDQSRGSLAGFAGRLGLAPHVEFAGQLSPSALSRRLAEARVFVLPSRRENFPIALLEAMSAGKAVVATRAGGVSELVRHGVDGLLVPSGDPGALTRAMRRLWDDPALRRRLGASARRRARRFSWDAAAAAYEPLYAAAA